VAGAATALTGAADAFVLTVTPDAVGTVSVTVPASAAQVKTPP
jgi:hypothetical protein